MPIAEGGRLFLFYLPSSVCILASLQILECLLHPKLNHITNLYRQCCHVHFISGKTVYQKKNRTQSSFLWEEQERPRVVQCCLPSSSVYVTRPFLFHIPDQHTHLYPKFFYGNKLCQDTRSFVLTIFARASALRQSYTESYLMSTKWLI